MAYINKKVFESEEYKGLIDKGYWFFTIPRSPGGTLYKLLHKKAALLKMFIYLYAAIFIVLMLFVPTFRNFCGDNQLIAIGLFVLPIPVSRLLLWGKIYDAALKDYLAMNNGKREGLYTSDESLYTSQLAGTYICQTCSTPIASTDDKRSVKKPNIVVDKLFDNCVSEEKNGLLACITCQTALGMAKNNLYHLNGEKLALNANELHLIYP